MPSQEHRETGPLSCGGQTEIWFADLDAEAAGLHQQTTVLSPDEIARRDRFVMPLHGWRFAAARLWLRTSLGQRLGRPGQELIFRYGPHGKPTLVGVPLHFNLAHREGRAALVISERGPVGIDLECRRPLPRAERLATQYFTPAEAAEVAEHPAQAADSFLRLWTRKEAVCKGLGLGLGLPLDAFEVLPLDQPRVTPRPLTQAGASTAGWLVEDVPAGDGWYAAVAYQQAAR